MRRSHASEIQRRAAGDFCERAVVICDGFSQHVRLHAAHGVIGECFESTKRKRGLYDLDSGSECWG